MRADVAVEHPGARRLRNHICRLHQRRHQWHDIGGLVVEQHGVGVPVGGVDRIAHADQIPADVVALPHGQTRQVAEEIAVDAVADIGRGEPGVHRLARDELRPGT